eukprot:TRINITY_DN7119_c0_g3_i1.p2 TRINITY_DN7119_c0_g3~~TRINITY_DN7119_c0_g3_i1.p2  ORF type:complete len:132 (+),score=15.85 TRINITY_DN7119_c0_g3_i1:27-422(+)
MNVNDGVAGWTGAPRDAFPRASSYASLSALDVTNQSALACACAFPGHLDPERVQAGLQSLVSAHDPILGGRVQLGRDSIPRVYPSDQLDPAQFTVVDQPQTSVHTVREASINSQVPLWAKPVLDAWEVLQG